jgi:outer membrane protein OmpA-like peptidoglycan-associated protein
MAPRIGEGAFGPPINVGTPVNGPRDDFAFIIDATNKHGFFSSNRPGGRGGDDIYAFTMLAPPVQRYLVTGTVIDAEYDVVMPETEVQLQDLRGQVLATALTDARGEYAFPVEKDRTYRIVAKAKGRFDGEQFLSTDHIDVQQLVTRDIRMVPDAGIWLRGVVRRGNGPGFLEGVTVSAVNLSSFFSESRTTGPGGTFSIRLQANEEFEVLLEKEGWFSISVPISTVGMRQGIIDLNDARDLTLDSLAIGTPHRLKHVRWPHGEVRLDNTAKGELDQLAERLLVNPRVIIEVGVHEDARTDPETARKLTQQRADAIVAYLIGKGVPRDHVTGKGYGNAWPLNHCIAGVPCSEEDHAVNRRTEYKVTALQEH